MSRLDSESEAGYHPSAARCELEVQVRQVAIWDTGGCNTARGTGRFGMETSLNRIGIVALWIAGVLSVWAQDPRGHWSGSVEIPNQTLAMEVDLDKGPNGWIGSISIPAQNASGIPLDAITFTNGKCTFHLKGAPGDPTFTGTLSADGKTMTGDFTQGPGGAFPFKFSRTGDPKVEEAKASPALAKDFLGTWEGTLEGPGLRLVLKMSNDAGGAKAVLISVDQGGAEIPVNRNRSEGFQADAPGEDGRRAVRGRNQQGRFGVERYVDAGRQQPASKANESRGAGQEALNLKLWGGPRHR